MSTCAGDLTFSDLMFSRTHTHLRPIKLPAPPASETLLSTELWDFCALGVFREEIETTGDSFLKFGLAIKISVLGGSIP